MATRYFCDVCGKEVGGKDELTELHVYGFERMVPVGDAWRGDACGSCDEKITYAAHMAMYDKIKRIKAEVRDD